MNNRKLNLLIAALATAAAVVISNTGISLVPLWLLCAVGVVLLFGVSIALRIVVRRIA
jgi:hypothetical protein